MEVKAIKIILASGSVSFFIGLLGASFAKGNATQVIIGSGLAALPAGFAAAFVTENKYQAKLNKSESYSSDLAQKLETSNIALSELKSVNAKLAKDLEEFKNQLDLCTSEKSLYKEAASQLNRLMTELSLAKTKIEQLSNERDTWKAEYDAVYEEYEGKFQSDVEAEVKRQVRKIEKERIQQIFEESDKHCQNFLSDLETGKELVLKYRERCHQMKAAAIAVGEASARQQENSQEHINALLEQIEVYKSRIALLQQELAGDLLEPEYGKFGYQWDARIVDDIARKCWDMLKIPLAVKGYKINPDGSAEGGYAYSRSQSVEALTRDLNHISGDIAKALGIHGITSVRKYELSDLIIIQWRCERPKPLKDDEIYRIIEPASACTKLLREAMNHRKGGKPTLRIMGATGEGKGIIAKALLADWVNSESGEVWLSDPMDGSDEDRWECLKAAKSAREAREVLKQFKAEFDSRKNKVSTRKDVQILALFDEFDKEHPRDDKDLIKGIWTAIRHHNMRLILMGQSSEVGSNGWQWDEMKNCACLFVGSGITTAIKHAKDLGLSRATANQLEGQNDQIQNWLESKNQGLDAANQYRVGLLVCGDKARFIEFPPAYKGVIKNNKSIIVSYPWESASQEQAPTLNQSRICPGCGGKLRKAGSKLRCENAEHTKEMGKKTFDLN